MKRFAYICILAAGCSDAKPTKPAALPPTQPQATKPQETKPEPPPVVEKKPLPTREEFANTILNRSEEEVVKAIGKADQVTSERWGNERLIVWKYRNATQDKNAKNPDSVTELWFMNGKVNEVKHR